MPDTFQIYQSELTGPELDEALQNIALVQQSVADAAQSAAAAGESAADAAQAAQTAETYGAIVQQNQPAIQDIADNLAAVQGAAQNAQNAQSAAAAAAASAQEAEQWAEQAQQIAQGAMGWYATPQALQSAHPTGQNGQWAIVGTTDTIWIWDSDTSAWVDSGSNMDLSQYYTKTEADARFGTVQQVQQAQSAATAAQSAADNAQSAAEQAQATANAAAVIEKIWQNPSPTVEYAAQTISVPGLADYDMIIIFTNANGTLPYAYNPPTMAPKMGNNEIHVTSYQGTFTRGFAVNFLLNSIAIGDAYTAGIDNRYLVPALIFGIKF